MKKHENITGYLQAQKQLKYVKQFYSHLYWYFIINIIVLVMFYINIENKEEFWELKIFWLAISWGIGIPFYAIWVFWRKPLYNKFLYFFNLKEPVNWQKVLFYFNLIAYIITIPLLVYINYEVNKWEFPWFLFSMTGWGIGITFHAMKTFKWNPFFGKDWEERKIKQLVEKENNSNTRMNHEKV